MSEISDEQMKEAIARTTDNLRTAVAAHIARRAEDIEGELGQTIKLLQRRIERLEERIAELDEPMKE